MEIQYFLPSEIARLILGYLKEQKCLKTYQSFLKESPHLLEYISLLKAGQEYPTTIAGKNLINMLQEYAALKLCNENKCTPKPVNALWRQFDSVVEHLKDRQVLSTRLNKGTTQTARTRCQIADISHEKAARCKEISSFLKGKEANVIVMDVSSIPTSVDCADERINSSDPVTLSRLVPDSADSNYFRESIQAIVGRSQKNVSAMGEEMASHSVSFSTRAGSAQCTDKLMQPSNKGDASLNTVVSSVLSENVDLGLEKESSSRVMRDKVSDDKRHSFDKMDNVSVCCNDHVEENLANCDYSGKSADEELDVEVACDIQDIHDMSSPQKSSKTVIKSPLKLQEIEDDAKESSKIFTASVTNLNSLHINQGRSLSETSLCRQHQTIGSQLPESDSPLQQKETGPKHFQAMSLLSSQTATGPIQIPLDSNMAQSSQTLSAIKNTEQKESSTTSVLVTPTKQHPNRIDSENFISSAKLLQSLTDAFQAGKSPRRKKPPKKRISSASASNRSATESSTQFDHNSGIAGTSQEQIIEKLLNDTTLHEKLAENINKGLTVLEGKHSEAKSQIPKKKDTNYYTSSSTLDDLFDMQESQMEDDAIQGIINLTKNDSTFDSLFQIFFDDKENDCRPVENSHSSGEITEKGHSADAEPSGFPGISSSANVTQPFSPHAAPVSPVCRGLLAQSPQITSNNTLEAGPGTHTPSAVSNNDSPVIVKSVVPSADKIISPHTQAKANFPLNSQNVVGTPASDLSAVNSSLSNIRTSEPVKSSTSMVMNSNTVTSSSYNHHPGNTSDTVTPSKTSVTMEPMFTTNGNYNIVHHGHLPDSPSVCQEVILPSTPDRQDYTLQDDSSPFISHMTQATARLAINSDLTNSVPPVVTEVEVAFSSPVGPRLTPRQQIDSPQTSSQMGGNEAGTTQQPGTYHSFSKEVITNGNNSTPISCISAPVLKSHDVGNLVLPVTKTGWIGMGPLSDATSNLVPSKSSRQVVTASINSHPSLLSTATNVFGSTINLADAASILPESFPMPQPESLISRDNKNIQAQKKRKGRIVRTEKTGKNKRSSDSDSKVASNIAASHEAVGMTSGPSNSTHTLSINASDVNIINHKLIILSPGGKSLIQIPIMGYEHSAESETVSGTVTSFQDNVHIWSENLESNIQLTGISTVASTITTVSTTTCGTTNKHVANLPGKMALEYNSTSTTASGSYEGLLLPSYVPEMGDAEQNLQQETVVLENAEPVPTSRPETASDVLGSETSPSKMKGSLNSSDKLIAYPLGLLCTKNKGIHVRTLDFGESKALYEKVLHAKQEQCKNIKTDGNNFEIQVSSVAKAKPSSGDFNIEGLATDNCENIPEVVERENEEVTTNKCRDLKQSDNETAMCKLTSPATFMNKPKLVTNSNLSPGELRMPGFGRGRRNSENEEVVVGVGKFRRTLYSRREKQEVTEMTTVDKKVFPQMPTISKPKRVMPKRGTKRTASPKSGNSDSTAIKGVPDDNATEHERIMALNSSSDPGSLEICIDETEVKAQHGRQKFNKKSDKNQNAIKKDTKETKKTNRRTKKDTSDEFSKTSSKSKDSSKKKSTRKNVQEECSNMSQSNSVGQVGQPSKSKRGSLIKKTMECSSVGKENGPSDSEKNFAHQPLKEPKETGEDEESKTQMNCKTLPSPQKSKAKRRTSKPDSDKDSTLLHKSSSVSNSCKNWKVSLKSPGTGRRNKKAVKSKDSINNRNGKKLDETAKSSSDTSDLQVPEDRLCTRTVKHNSDKVLKSKKASKEKKLHAESLVADFVQLKESEKKCKESAYITSPSPKELKVILTPGLRIPRDNSNVDDKEENKVKRNSFEKVKVMDGKENEEQLENIPLEQEDVMKGINKETNHISEEEIENACRSISESPVPNRNDDTLSISSNIFHTDQYQSENESVFETSHGRKSLSTSSPMKQTFESAKTSTPNSSGSGSDETPRKCEVLEKLGLTPKKNECEKPWELNSSQRPNMMDLMITQPSPSTKGSTPSEMKTPAKIKTPRKRVSTPHKVLTSSMTKLKSPLQSLHISPERNHSTTSLGERMMKENQQEPQNSQQRGQKRSFGETLQQRDLQPSKKVKQPKKEKKPDVMSKLQSLDIDAFLSRVHSQGQSDGISSPCSP